MGGAAAIDRVAAELGLTLATKSSIDGSFSGSRVLPVVTADGISAILKVTVGRDNRAWANSERELRFYRQLAARVDVATPRLLDHLVTDDSIAILITRHAPTEPPARWGTARWLALAEDLARIHGADIREESAPGPIRVLTPDPTVRQFWARDGKRLSDLVENPDRLCRQAKLLGTCFVHGDCHTDNVSPAADGLVWLDWQNAGRGNPATDLAFPSARATPTGAEVPVDAMIARYADGRHLERDLVRRAVIAAELLVLLFDWPAYADHLAPAGIRRVRERAAMLAGELGRL